MVLRTIDVVVNNFNYERFLGDAIDSALAQTHPQVRVIVVDDGSSDGSRAVIASYGDRVTAVLKENGGQASAFNAGFAIAQADVILFLDADDALEPDIAARVIETLGAQPDVAKVQWPTAVIDDEGALTGKVLPASHLPMPSGDFTRAEVSFAFDIPWMATSANAFPAHLLRRIMPMPEAQFRIGADWYLQHLTPLLGPVVSLDAVGGRRRLHTSNAYEQSESVLDLRYVRATIQCAERTRPEIERLAGELGVERPPGPLLSVSDQANRLISLRADPATHPVRSDTRRGLVAGGIRAARRRFDVAPAMRAAFAAWFLAMGLAPRRATARLAEWFAFPERRPQVNRLLGALHRSRAKAREGA